MACLKTSYAPHADATRISTKASTSIKTALIFAPVRKFEKVEAMLPTNTSVAWSCANWSAIERFTNRLGSRECATRFRDRGRMKHFRPPYNGCRV